MTGHELTIRRYSRTRIRGITNESTRILAVHSWPTGWQELGFDSIEHLVRFAKNIGAHITNFGPYCAQETDDLMGHIRILGELGHEKASGI